MPRTNKGSSNRGATGHQNQHGRNINNGRGRGRPRGNPILGQDTGNAGNADDNNNSICTGGPNM